MKLNKSYVIKHVLDSDVLIDISSNYEGIIKLNKTSKDICLYVQKNMSVEEIINELSKKYDVDINILKKDVNDFVNEMIKKGIFIND